MRGDRIHLQQLSYKNTAYENIRLLSLGHFLFMHGIWVPVLNDKHSEMSLTILQRHRVAVGNISFYMISQWTGFCFWSMPSLVWISKCKHVCCYSCCQWPCRSDRVFRNCSIIWLGSQSSTIGWWPSNPQAGPSVSRWRRWKTSSLWSAVTFPSMVSIYFPTNNLLDKRNNAVLLCTKPDQQLHHHSAVHRAPSTGTLRHSFTELW